MNKKEKIDKPDKPLTPTQMEAVGLVAACDLGHHEIAERLGIGSTTLARWKNQPLFAAQVKVIRDKAAEMVTDKAVSSLDARIKSKNKRWTGMNRTIDQRIELAVESGDAGKFPGADTGLFNPKFHYNDEGEVIARSWTYDRFLADGILKLEDSVADDLGQRVHRSEISGPSGGPIQVDASVNVSFRVGVLSDIAVLASEIREAGRWPTTPEECVDRLRELDDRHQGALLGLDVPGWEVPFSLEMAKVAAH
jgi:hypothetical protein